MIWRQWDDIDVLIYISMLCHYGMPVWVEYVFHLFPTFQSEGWTNVYVKCLQ